MAARAEALPSGNIVAAELDARRGILIMLLGIALFSILNGVVKEQVKVFPANQVVFFRNALALPPLLVILALSGGFQSLRTRQRGRHFSHAVTMTLSLVAAFTGFSLMPLADATAISFLRPLIVTALAAPLLGERVGMLVWCAVGIGFVGVLVIAQPTGNAVNYGVFFSLAAALVGALNMLQQRRLSLTEPTIGIVFWYMTLSSLLLLPTLILSWTWPTPLELAGLVGMGVASGVCQYISIRPLYYAKASTIAPVSYSSMIWSILIGFVWFGDVPTSQVILGSVIVLGATALVMYRGKR